MDFPIPLPSDRLRRQIAFLLEADKLKGVLRRSYLTHGERRENSGEHSWHTALLTMILAEYSNRSIDVCKVIRMMLIHDLVEIDDGARELWEVARSLIVASLQYQAP
jgi:putative hydrolase of HD superfamily